MPITYHPRGRQPISVNQPQGGSVYPFVEVSDDIRDLVADFYLSLSSTELSTYRLPAKLFWIHGFGEDAGPDYFPAQHAHDLIVVDADDHLLFDTRSAARYWTSTWDDRLLVVTWVKPRLSPYQHFQRPGVCRIIVHTAWSPDHPSPRTYPQQIRPERAILDERTLVIQPLRVASVKLFDSLHQQHAVITRGAIRWSLGHNMRADVEERQDRGTKYWRVTLHAEPGAGIGRAPCDQPAQPVIRSINGVGPGPGGDFQLTADPCLRLDRPIVKLQSGEAVVQEAALRLSGHCQVCCDCQDFINVYEAERRLRNKLASLRQRLTDLIQQYQNVIDQWESQRLCNENRRLGVALIADPHHARRVLLVAGVCNASGSCLQNIELHIGFRHTAPIGCQDSSGQPLQSDTTADVVGTPECGRTFRFNNASPTLKPAIQGRWPRPGEKYQLGGAWPSFWAHFDGALSGYVAYVTSVLRLQGGPPNQPIRVEAMVSGTAGGQPLSQCPIVAKIVLPAQPSCPEDD